MKQYFLSITAVLLVITHSCLARSVDPGESLWSMQRLVTQASCDVIIRQTSLSGGVVTISSPGVYCLAENITGKIVISSDRVVLDLNGKTITNSLSNGIEVNGVANVEIKNGSVVSVTNSGIYIKPGSARVILENVRSRDSIEGIKIESSSNVYINKSMLTLNEYGLRANDVSRMMVRDTTASDSEFAGFLLDASSKNFFANCQAINTGQGLTSQTTNIYGFVSADGSGNIFNACTVQNTLALTVTGSPNVAAGFALTGTESSSQITKCTIDGVETSPNGFAVPYGILLKYSFDALSTVTGKNQGSQCISVSWSPDGAYLATGGFPEGVDEIQIFSFDRTLGLLTTITGENQGIVCNSVSWSPDGAYLATGGNTEGADEIQVFSFDRGTGLLTRLDGKSQETNCFSVSWSPDGAYLATGGDTEGAAEIQVFSFDRGTGLLTRLDGKSQGVQCFSVSWSPDGAYLATGGTDDSSNDAIQIFSFDRHTGLLTRLDGKGQGGQCFSVSWSPDGAYLATGGSPEGADEIQIFFFDRSTGTLSKLDGDNQGTACISVSWSPDGAYLATGGNPEGAQIFKAFIFPSRNIITNNTVQAASGPSPLVAGVGISGSGIENLMIGNTSYNNAGFNYQLVTNVFDERFTQTPTALQNLSRRLTPPFNRP